MTDKQILDLLQQIMNEGNHMDIHLETTVEGAWGKSRIQGPRGAGRGAFVSAEDPPLHSDIRQVLVSLLNQMSE